MLGAVAPCHREGPPSHFSNVLFLYVLDKNWPANIKAKG